MRFSRRWPLSLSTPLFGLFSALMAFLFSSIYLLLLFPMHANGTPPMGISELNGQQVFFFLLLCASVAAALCGMFFWKLLMLRFCRGLATEPLHRIALLSGLVGFLQIVCTPSLMWIFYEFLLILFTHTIIAPKDLAIYFPGTLALGLFTVIFVIFTSRGIVLLIGIGASMLFALLARRIFR